LWLRYFNKIGAERAGELLKALIEHGIAHDLEAQAGDVGEETIASLGLAALLCAFRAKAPEITNQFNELGRRLGPSLHSPQVLVSCDVAIRAFQCSRAGAPRMGKAWPP
jgi:hypothetical protein